MLTRSSNKRKPVLAVYVRNGKKAKISGIPDGAYVLWDCCGDDFNWTMRDFYTTAEHKRWLAAAQVQHDGVHQHWTSYWSDSYYNYSQRHSQTTTHWTNWTVTLGTGESKYTKIVSESGFPPAVRRTVAHGRETPDARAREATPPEAWAPRRTSPPTPGG